MARALCLCCPTLPAEFDLPAIQDFFRKAIDFVSLSAYVPQATVDFQVRLALQLLAMSACKQLGATRSCALLLPSDSSACLHLHAAKYALPCPAPLCPQPCDMEGLMSRLDEEFQFYGLTLKQLMADGAAPRGVYWLRCVCFACSPVSCPGDWCGPDMDPQACVEQGQLCVVTSPACNQSITIALPRLATTRHRAALGRVWRGRRHLPHRRQEGDHRRGGSLHPLLW